MHLPKTWEWGCRVHVCRCIAHARPSGLMQIKVDTPAKGHGLAHEARFSVERCIWETLMDGTSAIAVRSFVARLKIRVSTGRNAHQAVI